MIAEKGKKEKEKKLKRQPKKCTLFRPHALFPNILLKG